MHDSEIIRILKPGHDTKGYAYLRKNREDYTMRIARLAMLAFRGPRLEGLEICHGNNDPADNRLSNLRYDTHQANMRESARMKKQRKLTLEQAEMARVEYAEGDILQKALAKRHGVDQRAIWQLLHGLTYTDAGGPILGETQ